MKVCNMCSAEITIPKNPKPRKHPDLCRSCAGKISSNAKTHGRGGKNRTPLYCTWVGMRTRCYTKSNRDYAKCGGVGIVIDPCWKDDFTAFEKWALENGYKEGDTVKRINIWGNYSPLNCKVVHIPKAPVYEHLGETKTASEWYDHFEISTISRSTFRKRLTRGWSVGKAAHVPKMSNATTVCLVTKYAPGARDKEFRYNGRK